MNCREGGRIVEDKVKKKTNHGLLKQKKIEAVGRKNLGTNDKFWSLNRGLNLVC